MSQSEVPSWHNTQMSDTDCGVSCATMVLAMVYEQHLTSQFVSRAATDCVRLARRLVTRAAMAVQRLSRPQTDSVVDASRNQTANRGLLWSNMREAVAQIVDEEFSHAVAERANSLLCLDALLQTSPEADAFGDNFGDSANSLESWTIELWIVLVLLFESLSSRQTDAPQMRCGAHMRTTTLGVDPALRDAEFYRNGFNSLSFVDESTRVNLLFEEGLHTSSTFDIALLDDHLFGLPSLLPLSRSSASLLHSDCKSSYTLQCTSVDISMLVSAVQFRGPVVLLVDAVSLYGINSPNTLDSMTASEYLGHFIVLFAFDHDRRCFHYADPFPGRPPISTVQSNVLDSARKAFGTDEDIIFIDAGVGETSLSTAVGHAVSADTSVPLAEKDEPIGDLHAS